MTCEELAALLPELMDEENNTLSVEVRAEAAAALERCPDCRQGLAVVRQARTTLLSLQNQGTSLRVSAGFETRLLTRLHHQKRSLALLELSSKSFGLWLIELINIIGTLLDPAARPGPVQSGNLS